MTSEPGNQRRRGERHVGTFAEGEETLPDEER
jgi:hypothetical protein